MYYHRISFLGGFLRLFFWLVLLVMVVATVSVPTSIGVQALLGVCALAGVFVLRPFVDNRVVRLTLLGVASVIVLRYWFWRLFDTLPAPDDQFSYAAALILFLVETYLIGVFFLSCFVVSDPVTHQRPKPVKVRDLPTVDILIPTLNEPVELLAVTLAAAKNISYPAPLLNVVLCDDGGTDERCLDMDPAVSFPARQRRDELTALCNKLGVIYRTRSENRNAKAGNLTDALTGFDGELVAIFDADHAPSRDFLARTVGYFFEDDGLALVQTPHFFLNSDPISRNLKLPRNTPPENELFYSLMHRGLDRWGGAFFCGSAAVLRRAAIDSVGGISGKTITEDAETAMMIHCKGWRSMYVDHAMVAGLQPESFASFLQQRGRWATGMMQLLVTRNPFFVRGLSFWQRLCYLNSMSYWMFPVVRLALVLAPLVYLFFGLEIVVTTAPEAVAYMGSYIAIGYLVQNTLFSNVRWPFLSEIYELAQAPYLIRAVGNAILRPRSARFKVTSKDETITSNRLSEVSRPLLILFLLMLAGIGALIWRWNAYPGDRDVLKIVGAWAIFNTLLVGASLRALVEFRQRRVAPRVDGINCPAVAEMISDSGDPVEVPCVINDISYRGLRVSIPPRAANRDIGRPSMGDRFRIVPVQTVGFEHAAAIQCEIVNTGSSEGRLVLGAEFSGSQDAGAYFTIAGLLNGDSRRWQEIRRFQTATRRSLLSGAIQVVRLAVAGIYHTTAAVLNGSGGQSSGLVNSGAEAGWADETPIEAQAFIAARTEGVTTPARHHGRAEGLAGHPKRHPAFARPIQVVGE